MLPRANPCAKRLRQMALKISRILHAGYVFDSNGTRIAFDPIFENPFSHNCYAFPDVEFDHVQIRALKFDAVFISHHHDDHASLESLDFLDRATPIYAYCLFDELFDMIRELGFKQVFSLRLNIPITVGAIEVIPRRALDADVDSIFQIRAAGIQVLNVVDSWIDEATLELLSGEGPWEMILWPFQTMRELEVLSPRRHTYLNSAESNPATLPPEWIPQLKNLKPRSIVPSSCQFIHEPWSWYNHALFPISYAQFKAEISIHLPDSQVLRMDPSVSLILNRQEIAGNVTIESAAPLAWVHPVGIQNVDYDFRPSQLIPPTSEISRHFPALSTSQTEQIHRYCTDGLLKKFRSMDPPQDPYFEQPRLWRLRVFDHTGKPQAFFYRLDRNSIEWLEHVDLPLSALGWTTDVAASKLYGALENGESLTSMYLRINDLFFEDGETFDAETKAAVAEVDIVEDPLIRCLFNGVFGAYQAAQLKRLKERRSEKVNQWTQR